jgi:predicted nucleic acid-binding protein
MKTDIAFWDTSAVVPLCVLQAATPAARQIHRDISIKAIWWGTTVEVRSAFARLRRTGELVDRDFEIAINKWSAISKRGRKIPPSQSVLEVAATLPDRHGLRALDAFQLASALIWCSQRPRNRPFVCADKRLGYAASDMGFDVVSLT